MKSFLLGIASHLDLRVYGSPIIHSLGGLGTKESAGFDAFIPLIDLGISLYVWSAAKFFTSVLFTYKSFDTDKALSYTAESFRATELECKSF